MGVRTRHVTATLVTLVLAVALTACGDRGVIPVGQMDRTPLRSQGFTVGWVPDGYEAGPLAVPTREPVLSDDSVGGIEPYLVVAPDGWTDDPDEVVFVALVDGSANQGGLEQAVPGYSNDIEFGADRWRFPNGYGGDRPADGPAAPRQVVVRVEAERGVRVHSERAPMRVIDALADAAGLDGNRPTLTHVPAGWKVVAELSASAMANLDGLALWPSQVRYLPTIGAAGSHVRVWSRGDRVTLTVATIDGSPSELTAAGLLRRADVWRSGHGGTESIERTGDTWWSEHRNDGARRLSRVALAPDGSLLLISVATQTGDPLPSRAELDRLAASVTVDRAAWDAELAAQRGAPPALRAGAVELERGEVGGIEWLLQATSGAEDPIEVGPTPTTLPGEPSAAPQRVEPALHLTGGRTLLPGGSTGTAHARTITLDHMDDDSEAPFAALLVLVDDQTMSIALSPGADRLRTTRAPTGRFVLVIPSPQTDPMFVVERFDAAGRRIPD